MYINYFSYRNAQAEYNIAVTNRIVTYVKGCYPNEEDVTIRSMYGL